MRGAVAVLLDVPVEPDGATGRTWVTDELAKAVYHQQPSLLERLLAWVSEQLQRFLAAAGGVDGRPALLMIGSVIAVVVVISLLVAGPVRRSRVTRRGSAEVFGDDTRSARELLASADLHAANGRWGPAVLDRFRALLRSLEDRAVLEPRPGRTADEGAREAGGRLPGCSVELAAAARLFDEVCYGEASPGAQDDARLRRLVEVVAATRPDPTDQSARRDPARVGG